ncbi:hypothetical protein CEUSTIGMA_g10353.t1 [Chlamydomonas eustigma]|uniref:Uncharacterized protein n=1 Tax=Chlamydomonas eustigma TaxID=1157962 RepID=A0A250XIS9_9CHLO|nr:hypothetical protein CEUSTIGMA_g10353.t1 [Chlamydomonas eustigma]|eukprot:GAX82926.1 hypothetical protein CEUSTIGMA_g10353.t1 [Chlamydomonas eustigma]
MLPYAVHSSASSPCCTNITFPVSGFASGATFVCLSFQPTRSSGASPSSVSSLPPLNIIAGFPDRAGGTFLTTPATVQGTLTCSTSMFGKIGVAQYFLKQPPPSLPVPPNPPPPPPVAKPTGSPASEAGPNSLKFQATFTISFNALSSNSSLLSEFKVLSNAIESVTAGNLFAGSNYLYNVQTPFIILSNTTSASSGESTSSSTSIVTIIIISCAAGGGGLLMLAGACYWLRSKKRAAILPQGIGIDEDGNRTTSKDRGVSRPPWLQKLDVVRDKMSQEDDGPSGFPGVSSQDNNVLSGQQGGGQDEIKKKESCKNSKQQKSSGKEGGSAAQEDFMLQSPTAYTSVYGAINGRDYDAASSAAVANMMPSVIQEVDIVDRPCGKQQLCHCLRLPSTTTAAACLLCGMPLCSNPCWEALQLFINNILQH